MLWKYTLQYYKNSHLDEVEIHSRIEGELRSDFVGISEANHTECVIKTSVEISEETREKLEKLINE